jgi:hypothetical protein
MSSMRVTLHPRVRHVQQLRGGRVSGSDRPPSLSGVCPRAFAITAASSHFDETTTAGLLKTADAAAQAGVQVTVRDYVVT